VYGRGGSLLGIFELLEEEAEAWVEGKEGESEEG
jgi:hypothetical protein